MSGAILGRPAKYPWQQMEVGDTCFVPGKKTQNLKGCVHHLKPHKRFRFCIGVYRGEPGTRVWRII